MHLSPTSTRSLMRKIVSLIFLLNVSAVFGLEDTMETRSREADRYLQATPPREMLADMAEQVAKTLPPDQRQALKDTITRHLDVDAVTHAMRDAMIRNFTAEELSALADFYGSTTGKSAMRKFGTYMAELMPVIQTEMIKASAKMRRTLPDGDEAAPNPQNAPATPHQP